MRPNLIMIRGSPASGKSTLARALIKKFSGKVALLILDEFKWIMTAHGNRDQGDFKIAFENYLFALKNYLKKGYTVIAEDAFVKKHKDTSTDINKVIKLGEKYNAKISQILLKGNWKTIKHINTLRPMVIPQKELKDTYQRVYATKRSEETTIIVDNKRPQQILKEALKIIKADLK